MNSDWIGYLYRPSLSDIYTIRDLPIETRKAIARVYLTYKFAMLDELLYDVPEHKHGF